MPRTGKLHALSFYEPVIRFANARLTEGNYLDPAFGFTPPSRRCAIREQLYTATLDTPPPYRVLYKVRMALESGACRRDHKRHDEWCVLRAVCKIGGKPIDLGAVAQLQSHIRRILGRLEEGGPDALTSGRGQGSDFILHGRRPLEGISVIKADDRQVDPLTADLQDIWYVLVSDLVDLSQGGNFRFGTQDGRRITLPFRPITRCEAPACHRFFFPSTRRRRTCSDKCSDRLAYDNRLRRGAVRRLHH